MSGEVPYNGRANRVNVHPAAGVGPFHWHRCEQCRKLGYRKSLPRNERGHSYHWESGVLDPLVYTRVIGWHGKIAHEMWDDFISNKKG